MNPGLVSFIDRGSQYLVRAGFEPRTARLETERLAAAKLGVTRQDIAHETPSFIDESMERDFLSLLAKRASGTPLQYLEGEVEFMDFSFRVSPEVLIPRPETENLVERILLEARPCHRVLDIGTGSGCILLALLKYFPQSSGVGTDISEKTLAVARDNAMRLGLEDRVSFRMADLLNNLSHERFDLIVSNPPYVAEGEWEGLSPEVKQEPREALVAGPTGLECFERIVAKAREYLTPGGRVFFEAGWNQAEQVAGMLLEAGFQNVQIFKDDFGIARIIKSEIRISKSETNSKSK